MGSLPGIAERGGSWWQTAALVEGSGGEPGALGTASGARGGGTWERCSDTRYPRSAPDRGAADWLMDKCPSAVRDSVTDGSAPEHEGEQTRGVVRLARGREHPLCARPQLSMAPKSLGSAILGKRHLTNPTTEQPQDPEPPPRAADRHRRRREPGRLRIRTHSWRVRSTRAFGSKPQASFANSSITMTQKRDSEKLG